MGFSPIDEAAHEQTACHINSAGLLRTALCEKRKVSDSYDPWFFRGLGVSPSHNTLPRVGSADREIWRPLKSQGKIAHLTTVSFRKVQCPSLPLFIERSTSPLIATYPYRTHVLYKQTVT